jgi:hypothetical protein
MGDKYGTYALEARKLVLLAVSEMVNKRRIRRLGFFYSDVLRVCVHPCLYYQNWRFVNLENLCTRVSFAFLEDIWLQMCQWNEAHKFIQCFVHYCSYNSYLDTSGVSPTTRDRSQ